MFLRSKLFVAAGSIALSALALSGCSAATPATPPAGAPAAGGTVQSGGPSNLTAAAKPDIRAGVHGSQERVVFDFSALPDVKGLKLISHELNKKAPVWGGSGEPVKGMKGKSYIHILFEISDPNRSLAGPEQFGQKLAQSGVVNDNSHGSGEVTIGVSENVDYDVKIEGEKVIVNMS